MIGVYTTAGTCCLAMTCKMLDELEAAVQPAMSVHLAFYGNTAGALQ